MACGEAAVSSHSEKRAHREHGALCIQFHSIHATQNQNISQATLDRKVETLQDHRETLNGSHNEH